MARPVGAAALIKGGAQVRVLALVRVGTPVWAAALARVATLVWVEVPAREVPPDGAAIPVPIEVETVAASLTEMEDLGDRITSDYSPFV